MKDKLFLMCVLFILNNAKIKIKHTSTHIIFFNWCLPFNNPSSTRTVDAADKVPSMNMFRLSPASSPAWFVAVILM